MAKKKKVSTENNVGRAKNVTGQAITASVDDLLLAALERGSDVAKTGRFLMTFKEGAADAGARRLQSEHGMRVASARDFAERAVKFEDAGDADALVFPEIGVALVRGEAVTERGLRAGAVTAEDSPVHSLDPEFFMFAAEINSSDYLKGMLRAVQTIYADLGEPLSPELTLPAEVTPQVAGVTWGLTACKVPASTFDGSEIKVAVLDTGFDLGHPEFADRSIVSKTFVRQPVQDLHGHGTHTTGTACGPQAPSGGVPRYGIGFRTQIFSGKVLANSGSGTQASVLAGMDWAIANRCAVISMSLTAPIPAQPSYTAAGAAALAAGCLIIAASGNSSHRPDLVNATAAPANSPTIVSVAALDSSLKIALFSDGGKVDIAGPGVNVFSSWPRPALHNTISGTSMATPHVAGCAALWAQSDVGLRGAALRAKLIATAKHLPFPTSDVGAGLVQAP